MGGAECYQTVNVLGTVVGFAAVFAGAQIDSTDPSTGAVFVLFCLYVIFETELTNERASQRRRQKVFYGFVGSM